MGRALASFFKGSRKYFLGVCLCLLVGILPVLSYAQPSAAVQEKIAVHNAEALRLLKAYHFEESREHIRQSKELAENPVAYYLVSRINNIECKYDSAILNAKRALELDPNYRSAYTELFSGYYGLQEWENALDAGEHMPQDTTSTTANDELTFATISLTITKASDKLKIVLILLLACAFLIPAYKSFKNKNAATILNDKLRISEVILASSAVSCALWGVFFFLSKWIWAQNPYVPPYKFTLPLQVFIFKRDGIESFCLYSLMFANIVISLVLAQLILKLKSKQAQYLLLSAIILCAGGYYYANVGFLPPMSVISDDSSLFMAVALTAISAALYFLYLKNSRIARIAIIAILVCLTLVTAFPPSLYDLSYTVDPAMRLARGFRISETYIQYDLFLTYLAVFCLKMHIPIAVFPYFGQVSYMLMLVGIFLFSESFFRHKWLSVLFITLLVVTRYYAIWEPGITIFQISPLRIDLWLILLFLAYKKGIRHWSVGLTLGLLVMFHRNMGLLYTGAYLQSLVALYILDVVTEAHEKGLNLATLTGVTAKHVRLSATNLLITIGTLVLCYIIFGGLFSKTAVEYQKYGVGMIPISRVSFYWYMPVILSSVVVLLMQYRKKLDTAYTHTGLFVVFLAIANSMYFFGRSHENTILIISTLFLLALFIILDIVLLDIPEVKVEPATTAPTAAKPAKNSKGAVAAPVAATPAKSFLSRKQLITFLPFLLILLNGFYYSNRIVSKTTAQYANFKKGQICFNITAENTDTASIRALTNSSDKLYFIDFNQDFNYYYFGNYAPVSYYNPSTAWMFNDEMISFMQSLLDKQYYIVFQKSKKQSFEDLIPNLSYDHSAERNNIMVISKKKNPFILPQSPGTVYHVALKDTLPTYGIDHNLPKMDNNCYMELLVRPAIVQQRDAAIFNNITHDYLFKGMAMQYEITTGQYALAISNGSKEMPKVVTFPFNEQWHYLCISLSNDSVKVYDNGKRIAAENIGGTLMHNSDMPMYIGNVVAHDRHFSGYIREVKITNGTLTDADIAHAAGNVLRLLK